MNEFDSLPTTSSDLGTVSVQTREQTEIQAIVVSAKKFPRDESLCYTQAIKSFKRKSMADSAMYSFPRGGQTVTGCSVNAAREIARCWKNLHYGLRIVQLDSEQVHIKGFCYDAESNVHVEAEDRFAKKIQRKKKDYATGVTKTEWVEADERDLRELINKRGSILIRNCILQIVPPDVVEDCMKEARKTMQQSASGELKANREDTIKKLCLEFDALGVSTEMLEDYLGHKLALVTNDELVNLRVVFSSIRDGNSKREEYFNFKEVSKASDLNSKLKGGDNGKDSTVQKTN